MKVYDLQNAGPRKRFMVRGGQSPLIVSNCENLTQAFARDVFCEQLLMIWEAAYTKALTKFDNQKTAYVWSLKNAPRFSVHDEVVMNAATAEVPYWQSVVEKIMTTTPAWCEGTPFACEAVSSPYYLK